MKKLLLSFFMIGYLLTGSMQVQSQEIGIRFGDVVGNDVAVDAIFSSGEFSRLHGDVSFGTGVGIDLLYDFLYRQINAEAFHWYVGVGPTLWFHDPFWLGVSGEIGLEYHFNTAPIALGVDWRPTFYIIDDTDLSGEGFGFNARYVFGKK